MKVPFIGGGYLGRSSNLDPQRCVNLYPALDKTGGKPECLMGTPGLSPLHTLLATIKGYLLGGLLAASVVAVIENFNFVDESSIAISTALDTAKYVGAAVNSSSKGYMMGGSLNTAGSSVTAVLEDFIFTSELSQAITASLDTAKRIGAGVGCSTKGYIMGGATGAATYTAVIEDLTYSTELSVAITATLDTAKNGGVGVHSSTKGYCLGGSGVGYFNAIEDLTFSTEASVVITATLDTAKVSGCGVNSVSKGYIMGGYTGAAINVIEDLIFANETSQAIAATLDTAKHGTAGIDQASKGYALGGVSGGSYYTAIEGLTFSTEASVAITATLDTGKGYGGGVQYGHL